MTFIHYQQPFVTLFIPKSVIRHKQAPYITVIWRQNHQFLHLHQEKLRQNAAPEWTLRIMNKMIGL